MATRTILISVLCVAVVCISIELLTPVGIYKTEYKHIAQALRSSSVEEPCTTEVQHLYLLKVHKAGSTSLQNLFLRFGLERDLNVLTIFKGIFMSYPSRTFDRKLPAVTPKRLTNGKYDIYCEHSIFDEEYLLTKLHADTVNIAIVREPWSQLGSAFGFYGLAKKLELQKYADPMAEFIQHAEFYVTKYKHTRAKEVTQNRVAMEFGFREKHDNLTDYLEYVESKFLVLITERFSESLVVMKRSLCWGMKEILYAKARQGSYHKPEVNETLVSLHKAWTPLDYVFYDYFSRAMDQTISAQDNDFQGEVALFEDYLSMTRELCDDVCGRMGSLVKPRVDRAAITSLLHNTTRFEGSQWSSGFDITGLDCVLMRMSPSIFRDLQKVRLFPEYCSKNDSAIAKLDINRTYCRDLFNNTIPWTVLQKPRFTSTCY